MSHFATFDSAGFRPLLEIYDSEPSADSDEGGMDIYVHN